MNPAEECLKHLKNKNWRELINIFSDNKIAQSLADLPTFSVFEDIFVHELNKHENNTNDDLAIVASRIFQIHKQNNSNFTLSENGAKKFARYLFNKNPDEVYAEVLCNDKDAKQYLDDLKIYKQKIIDNSRLAANLKLNISKSGDIQFNKEIFNNSPQEKELYQAAKNILVDYILLPNTALSTVIDSRVCDFLDEKAKKYFFKSTLDLCVVNHITFMPELFIELDSSWHDNPQKTENDEMKNLIFEKAGLKLHRIRKKENKEMIEIFEIFIKEIYT